jgi:hypothetical protein
MLETEIKFVKKIYVISYPMRWFLYQTICMVANITEALRNYYNKIETVGRGKVCGKKRRIRRAHMGDEERFHVGQAK